MEVSLQVNARNMPILPQIRSSRKIATSCRNTTELTMQRKKTNFYEVLSLESWSVGFDEIKRAYRSMALQYHPDVCSPSMKEESAKRFMELREAYETLSDPISRTRYDYELGLVSPIALGFDGSVVLQERKRSRFPKAVWEKQLHGLKQRSRARMEKKNDV